MSKPERNVIVFEDILARSSKTNVLFLNYDFMNTGIQESGATPPFASTTTGPGGEKIPGKIGVKQDLVTPFAFFGTKSLFLATANPAYPADFMGKVADARCSKVKWIRFYSILFRLHARMAPRCW